MQILFVECFQKQTKAIQMSYIGTMLGYQTSLTLIHIVVIGYGRNFLKRVIFLSRGTIFLKVALGVSHKDAF